MNKCVCLFNRLHGGECVIAGKIYLYKPPFREGLYYTLYEEDKIKNDYICSIYVHKSFFERDFQVLYSELEEIDKMFNIIMDGEIFVC